MSKKNIWGIVGIIVLVGVFFGGVTYGKSQTSSSSATASTFSGGARGARGAGGFGGATIGQIISKDASSITIELATLGSPTSTTPVGSKIVLLDSSTKITKLVSGTMADLAVGTEVTVTGTTDTSSGSISAQSIQIRPNVPAPTTPAPSVVQ
jgi:hypothetical protein